MYKVSEEASLFRVVSLNSVFPFHTLSMSDQSSSIIVTMLSFLCHSFDVEQVLTLVFKYISDK